MQSRILKSDRHHKIKARRAKHNKARCAKQINPDGQRATKARWAKLNIARWAKQIKSDGQLTELGELRKVNWTDHRARRAFRKPTGQSRPGRQFYL